MKRPEVVKSIKEALAKVAPDAKAILYGSEARGDALVNSDIDIIVLLDKDRISLEDEMKIVEPLYDIELETGILINPLFQTLKKWGKRITPFYENVMREGILL